MIVPRSWVLLMLLFGTGALAGCSVDGRIDVVSPTAVNLDFTVRGEPSASCDGGIEGLSVTPGTDPGGIVTCHYAGTVNPSALGGANVPVTTVGEYIAVVVNPFGTSGQGTGSETINTVDVTLVLPGDVVEHNSGVAQGRELRLTDPNLLQVPGGFRVVALNHAGPSYWLWWTGGGLVLGAVAGWAASWLLRRRLRHARGVAQDPGSGATDSALHEGRDQDHPGDQDDPSDQDDPGDQTGWRDAAEPAGATGMVAGEPAAPRLRTESTEQPSDEPPGFSRPGPAHQSALARDAPARDPDPYLWAPDA